jgi:uncharacterized membrane protein YbaN (DUF454 family)
MNLKYLLLVSLGLVTFCIGGTGLIIPIIPGFFFLALSLLCFALAFPSIQLRLQRYPRFGRLFDRIGKADNLAVLPRLQLTFWALVEAVLPKGK